jgi:hypothetical protein
MQVHEALDTVNRIHEHLTRAEVYRGFRVPAVAAVALLGLGAAVAASLFSAVPFVWYWSVVAMAGALIGFASALHAYLYREDEFARRRTRRVMAQFAPCILAGCAVTLALARMPDQIALLPGLWAVLFGLGIIACRPHLPPAIGLVGFGYVAAGAALLLCASPGTDPSPWSVGGVFGLGHLATAFVLWRDTARNRGDDSDD